MCPNVDVGTDMAFLDKGAEASGVQKYRSNLLERLIAVNFTPDAGQ